MMEIRDGLLLGTLITAVAAGLWGWSQRTMLATAQEATQRLEEQRKHAQDDADRNLDTANHLKSTLERERENQAKLRKLQGELRTGLADRERKIEALTLEKEELRNWADQPLPDAARRLRQRPALAGADAYRQWLSSSRAVPVASDQPESQRAVAQ